MPSLVKVCNKERSRKIFIKAYDLEYLITTAVSKFELPEVDNGYKIMLEEDGTEIPDTETLEMIEQSLNYATLMILPKNEQWTSKNLLSTSQIDSSTLNLLLSDFNPAEVPANAVVIAEVANETVTPVPSTSKDNLNAQPIISQGTGEGQPDTVIDIVRSIPWQSFPSKLLECCKNKCRPSPMDRRTMIQKLADYMIDDIKDPSRPVARKIIQAIVNTHPESFLETINGAVIGDGTETLVDSLYNRVHYRTQNDRKLTKSNDGTQEGKSKTSTKLKKRGKRSEEVDQYGCTQYEPSLSATETIEIQKDKKNQLLEAKNLGKDRDFVQIKILFDDTYPTQRYEINHRTTLVADVLLEWPILAEVEYFFEHASTLLGKPVKQIWCDNLKKNLIMHDSLRDYVGKYKKREERPEMVMISKILSSTAKTSADLQNNVPLVLGIFQLMIAFFGEDPNLLYTVVNLETLEDDLMEETVDVLSPVLVVKGSSMYDPGAICAVIIEKKICIRLNDTVDGILVTFLSYFVFGLKYPTGIAKTLEFMQRILLDINPATKGSKNESKSKKKTSIDVSVQGLYRIMQEWQRRFR